MLIDDGVVAVVFVVVVIVGAVLPGVAVVVVVAMRVMAEHHNTLDGVDMDPVAVDVDLEVLTCVDRVSRSILQCIRSLFPVSFHTIDSGPYTFYHPR